MSDQDFFFDEDEQPKKDAGKSGGSKKAAATPAASSAATAEGVSMTVMALVAVVAILVGIIIGIFVGRGLAASTVPGVNTGAPIQGGAGTEAPQLSPEQLQGGELPEGHPDIGGGAGAATETAPSEGETKK